MTGKHFQTASKDKRSHMNGPKIVVEGSLALVAIAIHCLGLGYQASKNGNDCSAKRVLAVLSFKPGRVVGVCGIS